MILNCFNSVKVGVRVFWLPLVRSVIRRLRDFVVGGICFCSVLYCCFMAWFFKVLRNDGMSEVCLFFC